MFNLTNAGGTLTALVPDICKVPSPTGPVPTPFPNTAQCTMADPGSVSTKVMVSGGLSMHQSSKTLLSNGDEAGTLMGTASNKVMGETTFTMGSTKVMIEGKGAVRNTDSTMHNSQNTNGMASAPSQTKVMMS